MVCARQCESQIGHTKAAAGAAGMFKAVLALHHGVFRPPLRWTPPIQIWKQEQSPLYINTKFRHGCTTLNLRDAGVSGFEV